MDNLLEIRDLYVDYITDSDTVHALNGVSLSLREGETLGIVGETGAGKTTLALSSLKILPQRVGVVKGGSILLDGVDVMKASPAKMRSMRGSVASMIFQDPMTSLNPVLTVGNQIAEAVSLHNPGFNHSQIDEKVDEMLSMVGIPPKRKTEFPHQFSGGMKQRVMIAIALCCSPKLLIADEPTTAIDVTIQAQVLNMMRELREKIGMAIMFITHDLGVVAQICDRVAIMYAGEVVEIGSKYDIYKAKYQHPYTKGLFGSIPNLKEKTRRLNPIEGLMPDPVNVPTGCKFHERCPHASERCFSENPPLYVDGTHEIKCHLFEGMLSPKNVSTGGK